MSEEKVPVYIPKSLYDRIAKKIEGTGFSSVDDYVAFVVEEVLATLEGGAEEGYTPEEEERVKERLRALGYV